MDVTSKLALVQQVGEEILTEEELRTLFETKKKIVAYDGFEPSGNPHIAQGLIRSLNVNKMIRAGIRFKMYAADWHAWANFKYGGDLKKIQMAGDYLIEVWRACGMDLDKVEFVRAVDLVQDQEYWKKVMRVAQHCSVQRVLRCGQIMGRSEGDLQHTSQLIYPLMQVADIFHMQIDIAQLGMDQRKVNVLAREIGVKLFGYKPVAVHHHMLLGLSAPPKDLTGVDRAMAMKMSKSQPQTAIFMSDTTEQIMQKMQKAYCPEGILEDNPVLEYYKYLIFEKFKEIKIERPAKFGGDVSFGSYAELESTFVQKKIHPLDVKSTCARYVDLAVAPVRQHFVKNKKAKLLQEKVLSFAVTR